MKWWEDKTKLLYGFIFAVIVMLVLFPSFGSGRPGIVSLWRGKYMPLEATYRNNEARINEHYRSNNRPATTDEILRATELNEELGKNFLQLRNRMIFVTPMPYKISRYVADAGNKFFTIQSGRRDELIMYLSLRDIHLGDQTFGVDLRGISPQREKLPQLLRRLAIADDLTRRAADSGITSLQRIVPQEEPYLTGPHAEENFLRLYPARIEFTGSFESIMKFLASLDGQYGQVTEVTRQPSRVSDDQSVIEFIVKIDVGGKHGIKPQQQFTIFDDEEDPEDGLRYKGRATVTEVHEDYSIAIVRRDRLPLDDELEERVIAAGDHASTNFYALLDLQIEAAASREQSTLHNTVSAKITVAAVGLIEPVFRRAAQTQEVQRTAPRRRGGY